MARGQLVMPAGNEDENETEDYLNEALAAVGLVAEEPLEVFEEFAMWPDCLPAFNFWNSIQTQWRTGMNGATGLDYQGVQASMSMRGMPKKERPEMFALVQAMERATLDEWSARK
ncbi:MAG TPA: DUF1799 domain-containing protein [Noviherbaspirillum sp.]